MKRLLLMGLLVFGVSAFVDAQCLPASATLEMEWDASTSFDVDSVGVFLSPTSGGHDLDQAPQAVIPVGTTIWTYSTSVPVGDGDHFVVVAAFDAVGNHGGPSNEVCVALDQTPPDASPTNLRITGTVDITFNIVITEEPVQPVQTAQR